jgi:hypothetical protein
MRDSTRSASGTLVLLKTSTLFWSYPLEAKKSVLALTKLGTLPFSELSKIEFPDRNP